MESLKVLYKIGHGPSSSHTMGPRKAAEIFLERNSDGEAFRVTLYGSLAATGKGHLTDTTIREVLEKAGIAVTPQIEAIISGVIEMTCMVLPHGLEPQVQEQEAVLAV